MDINISNNFKSVNMKNFLAILGIMFVCKFLFAFTPVIGEGSNGTHIDPYDFYAWTLRQKDLAQGSASTDSITVHNDATDYIRRIAPFNTSFDNQLATKTTTNIVEGSNQYFTTARARASFTAGASIDLTSGVITNTAPDPGRIINNASVGLSKAQLNTAYPNVPVGYMVMCPSIILGGAIYVKATEAGTSDVWQTISAPPTP